MKSLIFPSRSLVVLMAIGFIDLVSTAVLHAQGLIVELNPVMRFFIEQSEWLFAFVKALTLIAGWIGLAWYAKHNRDFVRKACNWGAAAYVGVWLMWFVTSH